MWLDEALLRTRAKAKALGIIVGAEEFQADARAILLFCFVLGLLLFEKHVFVCVRVLEADAYAYRIHLHGDSVQKQTRCLWEAVLKVTAWRQRREEASGVIVVKIAWRVRSLCRVDVPHQLSRLLALFLFREFVYAPNEFLGLPELCVVFPQIPDSQQLRRINS